MITIRRGVFETNSSSSHSIVMMKRDNPTKTIGDSNMVDGDWMVDKNGVMKFWYEPDLEFGRSPFELLTSWERRLAYAIASYANDENKINEIEEICKKRIAGFVEFKFPESRYGYNHGYIDHQSYGLLQNTLKELQISLEEFIFNDRYIVVIDGDEYCVFDTLMDTDMFNKDAVEKIIPECNNSNAVYESEE